MTTSKHPESEAGRSERTLAEGLTPFDAHPYQAPAVDADDACSFCGEPRAQIRHHPTRVRAAALLKGLAAEALPGRRGR